MIKKLPLFVILLITIAGCGSPDLIIPKRQTEISVDGDLSEWKTDSFHAYENGKFLINTAYDNQYLYLACRFTDRSIGRMFALNGVSIWIDPEGTQEKNLVLDIRYPGERKLDFQKGNFFAALNDEERNKILKEIEKINDGVLVIDKRTKESKGFINEGKSPFEGKMLINGNDLAFEIKIPRNISSYFKDFADLKFNTSNIEITTGTPSFNRFRNARPGMMGGRNNPAYPGGGGGGIFRGRRPAASEVSIPEIWIKLKTNEN